MGVSAPAPPLSFLLAGRDPSSQGVPLLGAAHGVLLRRHRGEILVIICVFSPIVKRPFRPETARRAGILEVSAGPPLSLPHPGGWGTTSAASFSAGAAVGETSAVPPSFARGERAPPWLPPAKYSPVRKKFPLKKRAVREADGGFPLRKGNCLRDGRGGPPLPIEHPVGPGPRPGHFSRACLAYTSRAGRGSFAGSAISGPEIPGLRLPVR